MRPVLFELGKWSPLAIPVLVAVLGGLLCLWTWLDARQRQTQARRTDYVLSGAGAVVGAVALWYLVNRFGPVPIRSYGFMLLLGLVCGLVWMGYSGRRYGIEPALLVDLALACLLGGIIGARLMYVALDWSQFSSAPRTVFKVWEGGLSFHGGLAGGMLAGYILARMRKIRFANLADAAAPALSLAYAFARIGCFLNGCCFGGHCESFWGVRFAPGSEAAAWSLGLQAGQPNTAWGQPLYPTQLLAAALAVATFFVLVALRGVFKRPGHLFVAYIGLYGVERFAVEFWRAGASGRPFPGLPFLTWAQVASIAMLLAAAIIIAVTWPRGKQGETGGAERRGAGLEACATPHRRDAGATGKKKDKRK